VLGFGDHSQVHARSDQDKALTYTYGRFEHYARMRLCEVPLLDSGVQRTNPNPNPNPNPISKELIIPSVLVIDFDEFVLCSHGDATTRHSHNLYTISGQQRALRETIIQSRAHGKDEMVWARFAVPNVSVIPDCLADQFALNRSIFGCYGGMHYKNNHNTIKTMHHMMSCPSTDFHFACCSACPCGKKYQSSCLLIHLRPMHSYKYKGNEQMLQQLARKYLGKSDPYSHSNPNSSHTAAPAMRMELADIWSTWTGTGTGTGTGTEK
jgi:hypothetical protein